MPTPRPPLKLGLQLGYWGAQPPADIVGISQEAERLGFDSVFTAEAWGSDAFTPLAFIAAHTERIRLGTAVVQISARTPAATAMASRIVDLPLPFSPTRKVTFGWISTSPSRLRTAGIEKG